ncbi:ATP-binding cassette domain-containing protein [Actinomadura barringtoniae]|uniref:ATP-binding cassette domain-containing protein n=1 Tax=Actinomadura barringtoniae TaxID=1427535 RepID=A0A939P8R4_9ACTN|nr:ATP-binding cassette domain-containing protein [Actinomadura barringtoniae]MBO2447855.1 ATP-binding cassette domain-containing protein [Actinomadura barringtoniae]
MAEGAVARAGTFASAAAGPLAGAILVLQADGLGGVVKVPGDVVTYMALTGLTLGCLTLPLTLWLARRVPLPGLIAVSAGLTTLTLAIAGLAPAAPVFATATMAAGVLAGPLLLLPRALTVRLHGLDAFAWWHAAALAGLAAAALLVVTRSHDPGGTLAIAGLAGAVLGTAAICAAAPVERGEALAGLRETVSLVTRALAGYATAGFAIAVCVTAGLHLMVFRWSVLASDAVARLAWATLGAVAVVIAFRHATRDVRTAPWLLLAAATAPVLMATAPGANIQAIGFAVALAAGCLAVAVLDTQVLSTMPARRRPAAAALTAAAAGVGGLIGWGVVASLRSLTGEGTALTLTALPVVAGALLTLLVDADPDHPDGEGGDPVAPALVEVRGLSVHHESASLHRVSLRVEAGETVALFGGGAQTMLTALAGHLRPAGGAAFFAGTDLGQIPVEQRAMLALCHLIGPSPQVQDERTVTGHLRGHARMLGRAEPDRTAEAILEIFPILRERGAELVAGLSESDRRLLGLAEAVIARPRLLLVDAISPGLAPEAVDGALAVVRRLAAEGTAVLLTDPRIPIALALAQRAYVLDRGRVIAELNAPTAEEVHLLLRPGRRKHGKPVQGGRAW